MKNLKIFFLSALVATAGLFTACSEDSDWSAGQPAEGPQVYFASTVATTYAIDAETSSVTIPVSRVETEGSMDAPILATISEEYNSLFTVPATVLFNEGEASTNLTITFDRESMESGKSYAVTLAVDDPTLTTPYGYSTLTITLRVPEAFNLLGVGLWRDDILTAGYSVPNEEWEIEIYEDGAVPGLFYLKNVYGANCPFFSNPQDPAEPHYLIVDASDPTQVFIPQQSLGINLGYGICSIGTQAYGTYADKIITFPANGLAFSESEYNDGKWYTANANGMFRIALPGAVLTDFSVEIKAAGHVADQAGNACPVVNVYGGADVAAVAIEFVEGDITADYASVVAAMAEASTDDLSYATLEMNKDTEKMEGQVTSKKAVATGTVTAVVLPYNADGEAQVDDAVAIAYYFTGCGAEAPACEIDAFLGWFSEVYGSGYEAQFPDATTMAMIIFGEDIVAAKYGFVTGLSLTQDLEGEDAYGVLEYVESQIGSVMYALPEEYMADINGDGLASYFAELPEGYPCVLFVEGENSYGQKKMVARSKEAYVAETETPAQQAMMGMKLMQYSGIKAAKVPFANR